MLAEATWLEIGFLWFQRFKRYGDQWQKGNASMGTQACQKLTFDLTYHAESMNAHLNAFRFSLVDRAS
jgi:hypothetical protein